MGELFFDFLNLDKTPLLNFCNVKKSIIYLILCRMKTYGESKLVSSSAQSSPSRKIIEHEVSSTAIPVSITGRQMSRSTRILSCNSPNLVSSSTISASGVSPRLQVGSGQTVYSNGQYNGTQNNLPLTTANIPLPTPGTHGGGAIPRRNIRRVNSSTEEEQCSKTS